VRTGALLFAAALILVGCSRAQDDSAFERPARHSGKELWTIQGVAPGDTRADIEKRWGKGEPVGVESLRTARWPSRGVTIRFDAQNVAQDVHGARLNAGDAILADDGMQEADVVATLGDGKRRAHNAPQSAGVIGIGSVETGATLQYENSSRLIELTFHKNALRGVRIRESSGG
jgi:hypothetical protein